MDSSCRVEELTKALHSSSLLSSNRYSLIRPDELCAAVQPVVLLDVRENSEREGGHIKGSIRCGVLLSPTQMDDLVARWREGCHIVFACMRSSSRAPLAAQRLISHMEQRGLNDFGPRVSLLEGGIVGFVEYLFQQHGNGAASLNGQDDLPAAILSGFDPNMWTVAYLPEGPHVAHITECDQSGNLCLGGSGGLERLVVEEASEELSFLMDHSLSLSPPPASSMPYIS